MRAHAEELRHTFVRPRSLEHDRTSCRIGKAVSKVVEGECEPLYTHDVEEVESGFSHFGFQLSWPMRVGAERPVVQRRQSSGLLDLVDERRHDRVPLVQPLRHQAVQPRCPSRDHRDEHRPTRSDHSLCLGESGNPLARRLEVVQRPQQQHGVDGLVVQVEMPGVADAGGHGLRGQGAQVLDVARSQVAVLDAVAEVGEPQRVATWPAADVSDDRWWSRQGPEHDLLGPVELHDAQRLIKTPRLESALVVRLHLREVGVHPLMLPVDAADVDRICVRTQRPAFRSSPAPTRPVHAHDVHVSPALPSHVQEAFGVAGTPVALSGGAGTSVRIGDAVLKPTDDVQEATWNADLLSRVPEEGFRISRPLRAHDGSWVVDGWSATAFVDGHPGPAGRWEELLAAAAAFHRMLRNETRPPFLDHRRHRWALADRVAWGEETGDAVPEVKPLLHDLLAQLPESAPKACSQLIHGDLAGNVLFAPGVPPAIIDFSPYWRPETYASAIVAIDGVLWYSAGEALLQRAADETRSVDILVRALIFRLIALNERSRFDELALDELPQFRATASMIERVRVG